MQSAFPARLLLLLVSLTLAPGLRAQQSAVADVGAGLDLSVIDAESVPIGPNHVTLPEDSLPGQKAELHGGRVVQIATGMNYWDGQQWTPSDATFDVTENGFVATRMQHKVRLNGNLNVPGAVTVTTRDGITLNSTPVGIGLYDAASGQSVIIAQVQDCSGVLVGGNFVMYEDAFKGVCADVIYKIEQGSFEQDVVITGRLDPADYGFSAKTTRLQIFTEFYQPPDPETVTRPIRVQTDQIIRNQMATPDLVDEILGFGEFVVGTGRAATIANIASADAPAAPVVKEFRTVTGRTLMIESAEFDLIGGDLKNLPECGQETASIEKPKKGLLSKPGEVVIPKAGSTQQVGISVKSKATRMAQVTTTKRPGFVIDYLATIGGTLSGTQVFQGDTTYFLTNAVTCSGAVTIEGGVVFKYPTNSTSNLKLTGTVICKTSIYRPAIFTAGDDDTVGDKITTNIWSGYTGIINTNGYGYPALWVANVTASALSNLRFRYCQEAFRVEGSTSVSTTLAHSQLVNCIKGIVINGSGSGCGPSIMANNNLFARVQYPLTFNASPTATFYHCTIDNTPRIITAAATSSVTFKNSVFANVTALNSGTVTFSGDHNGFYSSPTFGTSQYSAGSTPFQSVGAGNYYLVGGSNFRDVGVTNGLGGTWQSDMKKRTTYPPQLLTTTYSSALVLSPQAQRDTDTLDLGYHYDPVDYAVNMLTITNTSLLLTNGVALASFGTNGIWLQDGAQLFSEGTPLIHNHLTRFFNVQEQPTNWGGAVLSGMVSVNPYNTGVSLPVAQIRFTDFDGIVNSGYHLYTSSTNWTFNSLLVQDCSFNSDSFFLDGPTNSMLGITNNLFERVTGSFKDAPQITFYNNLYRYGTLTTTNTSAGTNNWVLKDNAFDSISITNGSTGLTAAYNAYINMGTNRFTPTNAFDLVLTNFTYTNGPLGNYYQSSTNFYDLGSRNSTNAGLYHYTVKTSEAKETNSIVDIGFHYVAVDGNGNPIDTDGDGIPDYLEDRNGNGTSDTGETDWQSATDFGMKVWITEPKNNSNIP